MNFKPNSIRFWMIVVAGCAAVFGLQRAELGDLIPFLIGAPCGIVLYRRFRRKSFRRGIIGGVLGGAFAGVAACLCDYGYKYYYLQDRSPSLVGHEIACFLAALFGIVWGAGVVMGLKTFLNEEDDRKRKQGKLERLIGPEARGTAGKQPER